MNEVIYEEIPMPTEPLSRVPDHAVIAEHLAFSCKWKQHPTGLGIYGHDGKQLATSFSELGVAPWRGGYFTLNNSLEANGIDFDKIKSKEGTELENHIRELIGVKLPQ